MVISKPSPDLLSRAFRALQSIAGTGENQTFRDALLTQAFYLDSPRLYYRIDRSGDAAVFTTGCLKAVIDHGCIVAGDHPLARLLTSARFYCGPELQAEIDQLVEAANRLCPATSDMESSAPARAAVMRRSAVEESLQTIATPARDRGPTVFISYAREDAAVAGRVIEGLRAHGHACWVDTSSIKGGEDWLKAIPAGIANSYALVAVLTASALDSDWVRQEILWARHRKRLIVPWLVEDVTNHDGFFVVVHCQPVRSFDSGFDSALARLLEALPIPQASAARSTSAVPVAPRAAELAYLERLRLEELIHTERYTALHGVSERARRVEMRPVFEIVPLGRDEPQAPQRTEDVVREIRRVRRAVLLGEPGAGKTTTLWKFAADLVETAVRDPGAPIPLLIRLGQWTDPGQPLPSFIASQLGGLAAGLEGLLSTGRAALLLDGLNELPSAQRDVKYPQVREFITVNKRLLAVVSCRELDYTVDLGFDRIRILPLDPPGIHEFAGRYLGEAQGEAFFWRLAGREDVRATWETWRRAGASFELFWSAPDIPRENPNVYGATTGAEDGVWREKVRGAHTLMELARNPYMLSMLLGVYQSSNGVLPVNRGELFRLFVLELLRREKIADAERKTLLSGLPEVAYAMQTRRAPGNEGNALTALPRTEVVSVLGERLIYLAASANLLSVGDQVRFTHQLLQEYFAACYMDIEIRAGRLKATTIWPRKSWWEPANWEEAAILLAGLYSNDCGPIVEWVAAANPEAAARCVARSGAALNDAFRADLSTDWTGRLTDLKREPNPLARAAIGRALGLAGWDSRKGVATVPGSGGAVLPDIDWVEIPAGEFQYGDPPESMTLPTFYLARYPVTVAQFQAFLNDPEGSASPRWFEGLAASVEDRVMTEPYFKFSNHPRETLSWYHAMAFCRWLSWRLGGPDDLKRVAEWPVRLPTEFEWEKAARGGDARAYPYGNEFDATKANTAECGIGKTSAVGMFPNGRSSYGVEEMSGNVWEWCLSRHGKAAPDVRKEDVRSSAERVLRGGSWFLNSFNARAVARSGSHPAGRFISIGFRVVCGVRPPSL